MRKLRHALLAMTGAITVPAAAEVTVTSHPRIVENQKAHTCTTISSEEVNRTGGRTTDEAVRGLPQPSRVKPKGCPPPPEPPVTYTAPEYLRDTLQSDSATPETPEPSRQDMLVPQLKFEPMGIEVGPDGPELPPLARLPTKLERARFNAWWDLEGLDEAFYKCDDDWIDEIYGRLKEDIADAQALLASGTLSKEDADDVKDMIDALISAKWEIIYSAPCWPKLTLNFEKLHQYKPEVEEQIQEQLGEKPIPPKIDLIEDLVEPPTPGEVRDIEHIVRELDKNTHDFPNLLEGCQPGIWDKHIAQLELLLKRARQMAAWARTPGQTTGVDPKEAQRVADEAQKAVDEAKRLRAVNCPQQPRQPQAPAVKPVPTGTAGAPGPAETTVPKPTTAANPQQQRLLDITNAVRARFGVKPLRWNGDLAAGASEHASHLADIKELEHASRDGRGNVRENLLRIRAGASPDEMMQVWMSEEKDFVPGEFPNVARDGHWENVAHLTQIIWPDTTDMGCAWVQRDGYIYLVCRYSPGGNKDGKPVGLMSTANSWGAYKRRSEYCSRQEQIDDLQTLQYELIHTDESTALGHTYGDAIRAEMKRVEQAKIDPCSRPTVDTAAAPNYGSPRDLKLQPRMSLGLKGHDYTGATKPLANQASKNGSSSVGNSSPKTVVSGNQSTAAAQAAAHGFDGPLLFTTMASDPKWLNPGHLEFGVEAVNAWASLQHGLERCNFAQMDAALGKLQYYGQAAREHSVEERSKGNSDLSDSYAAMAKQIETRIADGERRMAQCPGPEHG